jgi:hypothetical protein
MIIINVKNVNLNKKLLKKPGSENLPTSFYFILKDLKPMEKNSPKSKTSLITL